LEIREGLELLLTTEDTPLERETGEAGLTLLEEKPFDLLLLDVSLPDRNGSTCCAKSAGETRISPSY